MRQSNALASNPRDCVHIGDPESDIFELFCLADELGTQFLVRTCVDRLAQDGGCTVGAEMKKAPVKGRHHIQARSKLGDWLASESQAIERYLLTGSPSCERDGSIWGRLSHITG